MPLFLKKLAEPTLVAYYLPRIARGLGVAEAELRSAAGARPGAPAPRAASRPKGTTRQIEKEDLDDKLLLRFPIQYPEYIPDLDARGFGTVLATAWGKALWEKIVKHREADVLSVLKEGEKRLWTECRVERDKNLLTGEQLRQEWVHHCDLIDKHKKQANKKQLKRKLRQAQEAGDGALVDKYTKAYNDALRRDDEQH